MQGNPQRRYWDNRFSKEGRIWGEAPCGAALHVGRIFKNHHVSKVLVPGCGYGRNSLFLARYGFQVVGFDISAVAIEMAKEEARKEKLPIRYFVKDILDSPLEEETFEGIFSFNNLHLFSEINREKVGIWLTNSLAPNGVLALTSMSTKDEDFGKGEKVALNTFDNKKGRPVFYSDENSIRNLFEGKLKIESIEEMCEQENHGGRHHIHWMWFFVGLKNNLGRV